MVGETFLTDSVVLVWKQKALLDRPEDVQVAKSFQRQALLLNLKDRPQPTQSHFLNTKETTVGKANLRSRHCALSLYLGAQPSPHMGWALVTVS